MKSIEANLQSKNLSITEVESSINKVVDELSREPAVFHPYGFLVFRLPIRKKNWGVKMHVWLSRYRPQLSPSWPIHSHARTLSSMVLLGTIRNLIWNFDRVDSGSWFSYVASYDSQCTVLRPTGEKGDVIKTSQRVYSTGDTYDVPAGAFHSTEVPLGQQTVTLVMTSTIKIHTPIVLSQEWMNHSSSTEYLRASNSLKDELSQTLEGVLLTL